MRHLFPVLFCVPIFAVTPWSHPVSGWQIPAPGGERLRAEYEETASAALELIGVQPGSTVADIGAGAGYFTWRLAERVGDSGKVFAVEFQPPLLDRIRKTVTAHGFNNVKIVRGTSEDPHLPSGKIDLALLAAVYHEFPHPQATCGRSARRCSPKAGWC